MLLLLFLPFSAVSFPLMANSTLLLLFSAERCLSVPNREIATAAPAILAILKFQQKFFLFANK